MASKDKETEQKVAQQSLDQMLETIGPYLPRRLFGSMPEPSDWKIAHKDAVVTTEAQVKHSPR
jgi:hypothetical protein